VECKIGDSKDERASGISITNAGIVGDPGEHDRLDLNEKELQLWFKVHEILNAVGNSKTMLDILGELIAELGPDGVHEVDETRIKAAFDGIKGALELKHASNLGIWVTVSGKCCRDQSWWFANAFEEHDFHFACSEEPPNPNRAGIEGVDKIKAQQEYDDFINGGGLKRCREEAEKAYDCSMSSNKAQLSDPNHKMHIK